MLLVQSLEKPGKSLHFYSQSMKIRKKSCQRKLRKLLGYPGVLEAKERVTFQGICVQTLLSSQQGFPDSVMLKNNPCVRAFASKSLF